MLLLLLIACAHAQPQTVAGLPTHAVSAPAWPTGGRAKNVVLVIGDGMGLAQVHAAMVANHDALYIATAPVVGLSRTAAADAWVTDSAASATQLASGEPATYRAVGLDAEGQPVTTLVDLAEARGLSTGLLTTTQITHATPASFYAHETSRYAASAIARDLVGTGVDLLVGGGREHFPPALMRDLAAEGLVEVTTPQALAAADRAVLFLAKDAPPAAAARDDVLRQATAAALERLARDEDGFFLMVEGGQVDWGGHRRDAHTVLAELLDLDRTLGAILDFARADGETLVVVTGDHETGGMALIGGEPEQGSVTVTFETDDHTGLMVPVFAWGPGATAFSGVYDHPGVHARILTAWTLAPPTAPAPAP